MQSHFLMASSDTDSSWLLVLHSSSIFWGWLISAHSAAMTRAIQELWLQFKSYQRSTLLTTTDTNTSSHNTLLHRHQLSNNHPLATPTTLATRCLQQAAVITKLLQCPILTTPLRCPRLPVATTTHTPTNTTCSFQLRPKERLQMFLWYNSISQTLSKMILVSWLIRRQPRKWPGPWLSQRSRPSALYVIFLWSRFHWFFSLLLSVILFFCDIVSILLLLHLCSCDHAIFYIHFKNYLAYCIVTRFRKRHNSQTSLRFHEWNICSN